MRISSFNSQQQCSLRRQDWTRKVVTSPDAHLRALMFAASETGECTDLPRDLDDFVRVNLTVCPQRSPILEPPRPSLDRPQSCYGDPRDTDEHRK
jgi:hypothetical protein